MISIKLIELGCKWVSRKKLRTDWPIEKFKAKVVVIGCKQVKGVDFFNTYSSISKVDTIRVLIALACIFNLEIHQMNVKAIFLMVN